jgi:hypothetical protein
MGVPRYTLAHDTLEEVPNKSLHQTGLLVPYLDGARPAPIAFAPEANTRLSKIARGIPAMFVFESILVLCMVSVFPLLDKALYDQLVRGEIRKNVLLAVGIVWSWALAMIIDFVLKSDGAGPGQLGLVWPKTDLHGEMISELWLGVCIGSVLSPLFLWNLADCGERNSLWLGPLLSRQARRTSDNGVGLGPRRCFCGYRIIGDTDHHSYVHRSEVLPDSKECR